MQEIIALFIALAPHLSGTTGRQLSRVVFALPTMTGRGTMDRNIQTEVYQMELRHRKFTDPLNIVCILKTNQTTKQQLHTFLFSPDLDLDAEKMIDYYSLRFHIEFSFRDAKQHWGLQDFMNVNEVPINTAANLSKFMVSVFAKLAEPFRRENPDYSVLDLKSHYRELKYIHETLKILPQNLKILLLSKSHSL